LTPSGAPAFHTAQWRHDVDLSGKRVAVIGTGCSAIQVVPAIQPYVESVTIYQRSPAWTIPRLNFAYPAYAQRIFARFPTIQRLDRAAILGFMELGALAMTRRHWLLPAFRAVARHHINKAIADPHLRRKVTPVDEFGCKRVMPTDTWYPTLTKPNVELIDDPIAEVTSSGIRTMDGTERAADVLVFATGFNAHGFVAPMEIIGEDGRTLGQAWSGKPRAYLGVSVPRFPNFFLLYGPNTGSGTGSVIYTIEAGMSHVISALEALERANGQRIEVHQEVADGFDAELRSALAVTVWQTGCTSWYVDDNGHNPILWPWTSTAYRRRTERIDPTAYHLGVQQAAGTT
jgi:cation diffusion facilitator CzcD-associated flavoprotein CzcO